MSILETTLSVLALPIIIPTVLYLSPGFVLLGMLTDYNHKNRNGLDSGVLFPSIVYGAPFWPIIMPLMLGDIVFHHIKN